MITYDAIIIGAGMGGAASAYALTQRGLSVLILEAGEHYDPAKDYHLDQPDWEIQGFPYKANGKGQYTFGTAQSLEDAYGTKLRSWNQQLGLLNPTNQRRFEAYHHVRGVGGSTLHFTGEAHRLNPQSMNLYSRFGVAMDWAVSYAELEPFYVQAEKIMGVAGDSKARTACWRSEPFPLSAHPPSYTEQKLGQACQQLGLNWQANSLAVLSQAYQDRPACNYCAGCNLGCPRRDKGSADVTFIAQALKTGHCTVQTGVQVLKLEGNSNDTIKQVVYAQADGSLHQQTANIFVLAAGAIETPRLLLASDNLANESAQVGRNFMETLFFSSLATHPEALGSHRGLPTAYLCWDFNAPDAIPNVIGGCRFSPVTIEAGFTGAVQYATRVVSGWGKAHKQAMRQQRGNVIGITGIGEFLPNPQTFIDLDPDQKDRFGVPLARIHSALTEMDKQRLSFIAEMNEKILSTAGAEQIFERYGNYDFFNSTHVFGTCRMGKNPEDSVVNAQARSHRWKNLYIADASIFPSSGGGESPSLTIATLALKNFARK
jgi:choline dehydrogenase-like flavoprotein